MTSWTPLPRTTRYGQQPDDRYYGYGTLANRRSPSYAVGGDSGSANMGYAAAVAQGVGGARSRGDNPTPQPAAPTGPEATRGSRTEQPGQYGQLPPPGYATGSNAAGQPIWTPAASVAPGAARSRASGDAAPVQPQAPATPAAPPPLPAFAPTTAQVDANPSAYKGTSFDPSRHINYQQQMSQPPDTLDRTASFNPNTYSAATGASAGTPNWVLEAQREQASQRTAMGLDDPKTAILYNLYMQSGRDVPAPNSPEFQAEYQRFWNPSGSTGIFGRRL